MKKYFVNHREVTYQAYLKSNESDKMEFECNDNVRFFYDSSRRLIKVNDEWV